MLCPCDSNARLRVIRILINLLASWPLPQQTNEKMKALSSSASLTSRVQEVPGILALDSNCLFIRSKGHAVNNEMQLSPSINPRSNWAASSRSFSKPELSWPKHALQRDLGAVLGREVGSLKMLRAE
jgi:hypothetical protein